MNLLKRAFIISVLVLMESLPHRVVGAATTPPAMVETPSLSALVAAGRLPPVRQRIPETPSVAAMDGKTKTLGRHGGELRILMAKPTDTRLITVYGYARLVIYDDSLKLVPDLLERFEVREGRMFTLHLRKGHRWSDGHPFTTEDFRYYWEDVANNSELSPLGPDKRLIIDRESPFFEVIDERTVRFTWSRPNPYFLAALADASPLYIYRPSHYLKQFHARYADETALLKKAREAHHVNWAALHQAKDRLYTMDNPDLPTLQPWLNTTKPPSIRFLFKRNPFYHRIDAAGRQLPYIDAITVNVALANLIPAKTGAGESDLQSRYIAFEDYTFLKESEPRYNFSVRLWGTTKGAHIALYPNLNTSDPTWRQVIRDVRFRQALSLAIDREEINEVVYFGLAKVGNNTVLEASPLFKPAYRTNWCVLDLMKANQLLDQMGLTKRNKDGIRLLPDGRPMVVVVDTSGEKTETTDVLELIGDTWSKIGVKMLVRPAQRDIFRNRVFSGQSLISVWSGLANGVPTAEMSPDEFVPTRQYQLQWPMWGKFIESRGKAGEPPDLPEAKALLNLSTDWRRAADPSVKTEIWHRILEIHSSQVYSIGIINRTLQPVVVSNRLRNVPTEGFHNWNPGAYFGIYRPDTFWFANE
jgi:peptide/nickel transport system substrate-binding protein